MDGFSENNTETNETDFNNAGNEQPKIDGNKKAAGDDIVDENKGEIKANDKAIRLASVPDKPAGYIIDDKVSGDENFDPDLYESFRSVAHSERIPQGVFEKTIAFWNAAVPKYAPTGFGRDFIDDFMGFAEKNHITEGQVKSLHKWFSETKKKSERQLAQIKRFSQKAGKSTTSGRAAEIQRLTSNPAYTDKNHKDHQRLIKRLNAIYQGR